MSTTFGYGLLSREVMMASTMKSYCMEKEQNRTMEVLRCFDLSLNPADIHVVLFELEFDIKFRT